ncbi:MAG: hypothetical protein H6813_02085 [Phycisphaeraceae bacterium]|nr:hypothetical protein [Phycisphaeraceae bacterium]
MSLARGDWTLPGFDGEPINGVTEAPAHDPSAMVILAHGFTAHRDWGFLPALSGQLVARCGVSVARLTFSHAGVTGADGILVDRPDLFERDSWGKQVFDLGVVLDAARAEAAGIPVGIPVVIAGHSRGGGVCLLLAGQRYRDGAGTYPDGVIAIQSPDRPGTLSDEDCAALVRAGSMPVTAPITGQALRIGADFGRERLERPEDFDVLTLCSSIGCPVLSVGGSRDRLVPPMCADRIARACRRGEAVVIEGANHMFNTPEPPAGIVPGSVAELARVIGAFIDRLG